MSNIYSKDYKEFLAKLRRARKEAGLTQMRVSKILNKQQSFVSKCESGERRVDIVDLKKFAKIYHKPLSYFG